MPTCPPRVRLVVPIRGGADAKTRLTPPPGVPRADLAAALARDTLAAVARVAEAGEVDGVVVTADPAAARWGRALGLGVRADPGGGLNAAVARGWAGAPGPVAALLGDVPALQPGDLRTALDAALTALRGAAAAFVPDADGRGTVLLVAGEAGSVPRFGPGSAAAHEAVAARLDLDLPRLRRDVDTAADLRAAAALRLGPATAALLARGR